MEAGRSLTLAEKGGAGAEEVVAAPGFRLVATMNPGGDYGKRELSPALANRFTSVWVPPNDSLAELEAILRSHLEGPLPLRFALHGHTDQNWALEEALCILCCEFLLLQKLVL